MNPGPVLDAQADPSGQKSAGLLGRVRRLLYDPAGPLTQQLQQSPGGFGLGLLPSDRVPEATTSMICGFCSTGCALDIQLRGGEAVGLRRRSPIR